MKKRWVLVLIAVMVLGLWLSGCATTEAPKKPYRMSPQGTVIWNDEFEFKPPPSAWKIIHEHLSRFPEQGQWQQQQQYGRRRGFGGRFPF